MSPEPTIFLVNDDPAVGDSTARLLRASGYSTRIYRNAEAFLSDFDPQQYGCLILDLPPERISDAPLQDELIRRGVALPILVVSGLLKAAEVAKMIKAGAIDFLEKPIRSRDLLEAIEQALEAGARRRRSQQAQSETGRLLKTLTRRERETMDLLLVGKNTKQIARELAISPKTVDNHRAKVLKKMRVDSAVALLRVVHHLEYTGDPAGMLSGSPDDS